MKMQAFPSWVIATSAVGLGCFGFVVAGGVFLDLAGMKLSPSVTVILTFLVGVAAAYFSFKYSRKYMLRHISKAPESHGVHDAGQGGQRRRRIARAFIFAGLLFLPVFIFAFLSSIINAYV